MNKLKYLLAAALLFILPLAIYAKGVITVEQVSTDMNTKVWEYRNGGILAVAASATDVTLGLNGVMAVPNVATSALDVTTGFAPPNAPFGCKVNAIAKDVDNNGTVTCSNVTVCGVDQFDRGANSFRPSNLGTTVPTKGCENLGTVAEGTEVQSVNVFRRITRITTSACSGGGGADVLRISCSNYVGLPHIISSANAVKAIGIGTSATNTMNWYNGSATTVYDLSRSAVRLYNTAGTADISGAPASVAAQIIAFVVRGTAGY